MWLGSAKKASINDATSVATTTLGMMAKNFPRTPVIRRSGRKAAQVVAVDAATGHITSSVPRMAARRRESPPSTCRCTFSIITIASSTTMPTESVSAKSESRLMVMPICCITIIPPARATGMPIAAISPLRKPMKSQRMPSTSTRPMPAFE